MARAKGAQMTVVPMDAADVDRQVAEACDRLREKLDAAGQTEQQVDVLADPEAGTYTVRPAPDRGHGQ